MFDNNVSRFPPGLNANRENGIFSDMYIPDRIGRVHEYSQDFDQYVAGDWTLTGGGSAALQAADGGVLLISSLVSAFQSLQDNPGSFVNVKGFRTWGRVVATIDSIVGNALVGLLNTTATPLTAASQTDGIFLLSAVTTGLISLNVAVGAVIASLATGVTLVAGQPFTFEFYYDGACYNSAPLGRIVFTLSGPGVSAPFRGEIVVPAAGTIAAFPGATLLTPTMVVNAPTAVVRTLAVDTLYFAKDRANINASPVF